MSAANKGTSVSAESTEGRAGTKGNPRFPYPALRRSVGQFLLQFENLGALHRPERQPAQSWQDMAPIGGAGVRGRLGLHAHAHMLFEIARRQVDQLSA